MEMEIDIAFFPSSLLPLLPVFMISFPAFIRVLFAFLFVLCVCSSSLLVAVIGWFFCSTGVHTLTYDNVTLELSSIMHFHICWY